MQEQAELKDTPFTSSLKKAQGLGFIGKIKPVLQRHQKIFEPAGSSASRNPLLLRNTFNIEVYNEFLKQKRDMRNKFKQEYQKREEEVLKYILSRGSSGQDVNKRIRSKLGKIAEMKESSGKRTQLLKLLSDEIENAGKMDTSYFSVMEMDLDTDH